MILKKLVRETKRIIQSKKGNEIAIAWYKPEQWNLLLKVSKDRDQLEKTYTEWKEFAENALAELTEKGIKYRKIEIDIEELTRWCRTKGIPFNAESRSEFAANKLRLLKKG